MKHELFIIRVMGFLLVSSLFAAQQLSLPSGKVDLGYNPRELHEQMARAKAGALEKSRALEKSLASETVSNWQEYDITYYDIHWLPVFESLSIYGEIGMYGRSRVDALDSVVVNLYDSLVVDSVFTSLGNLPFDHRDNHIFIQLDRSYLPGEEFGFTVVYHGGKTCDNDGGLWFSTRQGIPIIDMLSEPYCARNWWPCNDIPVDKADSIDVRITVDTGFMAASNGVLIDDIDHGDGHHTMHWSSRYPIATYLICLAVSKYLSWADYHVYTPTDSMPIVNYVFPDQYTTSMTQLAVTVDALDIFTDMFGQYPFIEEKYGHTQVVSYWGMENQENTFLTVGGTATEALLVHELAHQWWGDWVTCRDWHHIWLNEGFATYAEGLFLEATEGPLYLHVYMQEIDYFGDGTIYSEDTSEVFPGIFNNFIYCKGAWVLHMLRHMMGDSAFFAALQAYGDMYAFSTATTEDFQAVCESVYGSDLGTFFHQWIYEAGRPFYRHAYHTEEAPGGGWDTYIIVKQVQETEPRLFNMPFDVRLKTTSGYEWFTLADSLPEQLFIVHTDDEVLRMDVDPDNWVLCYEEWEHFRIRILYDSLSDGAQYEPYEDSLIIRGGFLNDDYVCEVISGAMPVGWELGTSTGIITGEARQSGNFSFMILVTDEIVPESYRDSAEFTVHVEPGLEHPGDANGDDIVNVGDVVYVINYLLKQGAPPPVPNWADVNGDCQLNIGDAVYLVNFVFKEGTDPRMGCVE